ncbi:MAG: sigma 54-interacting transcriptional regulator, partial [Planctomycetota bacterium]
MTRFQNDEVLRFVQAAAHPDPARVLEALLEAARAERGFLVLSRGAEFEVACSRHMDGQEILRAREKISRTLLDRSLKEGRPVTATDADLEAVPSLQGQRVRSVCVLPLPASRGAVYLDSRIEKGLFPDLDYLGAFARALDQALGAARERSGFEDLVGTSAPMREVYRLVKRAASTPYPVLVLGESGTGKELV